MVVYSVDRYVNWNKGKIDNVEKIIQERTDHTYKCKCGKSVVIKPGVESVVCHWCGYSLYVDKEKQRIHDEEINKREALLQFKKEMRKRL